MRINNYWKKLEGSLFYHMDKLCEVIRKIEGRYCQNRQIGSKISDREQSRNTLMGVSMSLPVLRPVTVITAKLLSKGPSNLTTPRDLNLRDLNLVPLQDACYNLVPHHIGNKLFIKEDFR